MSKQKSAKLGELIELNAHLDEAAGARVCMDAAKGHLRIAASIMGLSRLIPRTFVERAIALTEDVDGLVIPARSRR